MQCGCSVVCTAIDGYMEVAIDNETALLYEPGNVILLVEKIEKLLNNENLLVSIAKKGNEKIQNFSTEVAVNKFENYLSRLKGNEEK